MAEGRCRSCGGTVTTGAAACPHCGVEAPLATGAAGGGFGGPTPDGPPDGRPGSPPRSPHEPPAGSPAGMGTRAETGPLPERDASAGSRVGKALKALGCLVLAGIVLAIAVIVGVFDLIF